MHYAQPEQVPPQQKSGGASDQRVENATRDHANGGNALNAALNESPRSQGLMQLRAGLDESPRVQKQLALQRALNGMPDDPPPVQKKPNATGLPDRLKAGVEQLSGLALDDVRVHYNSSKPAAVQAQAYAQGTDIHLAPGQEKHLPHEAWHVVQQKQGRVKPTLQMKGVAINDDAGLEREADRMGATARTSVQFRNSGIDRTGDAGILELSSTPQGLVIQRADMLVLVGNAEDLKHLVPLEEKEYGLKAESLERADLTGIGSDDTLYLSGEHGDESSYGRYTSGKALAQALARQGLKVCKLIVLTGCNVGDGFSKQFYEATKTSGVEAGSVTAPITTGSTRIKEGPGRMTAFTEDYLQIKTRRKAIKKEDDPKQKENLENDIKKIKGTPGYLKEIENPFQLALETEDQLDSIDRTYPAETTYEKYVAQFTNFQKNRIGVINKAMKVWAVHGEQGDIDRVKRRMPKPPIDLLNLDLLSSQQQGGQKSGMSDLDLLTSRPAQTEVTTSREARQQKLGKLMDEFLPPTQ